jgi:glyoxylase-like metal-dependent hydrolase (beta-lactamase superfamily II)
LEAGVEVVELAPGLWRWTGWHEEWKEDVGCVYLEAPDAVVLVDPLVPPEDRERFLEHLDRDVQRAGKPLHVLLTIYWHNRSAGELARRYRGKVWAPVRSALPVERRGHGPVDGFRPGDELPGGVQALASGRAAEVLFWLPEQRALVAGDVLLGSPLRICPASWVGKGGQAAVREALRPVLHLPVERVLVSHGEPVLRGGRSALARLAG